MAFNGAGTFVLISGNPVITGTTISSTWANNTLSDLSNNGLSLCLTKDGQQTPTANIPLGGFRLTGVGNAVNAQDAVTAAQLQGGGVTALGSVVGTDTITATTSPAIAAYAKNQVFSGFAVGANTTNAVTLNINGLGAKNVTKFGANALAAGDIQGAFEVLYDGTEFQLLNPNPLNPPTGNLSVAGNITATGTITGSNITASSDERIKTDWKPPSSDFLERLASLKRGTFSWIHGGERSAGIPAQELRKFFPEVIREDSAGYLSVAYGNAALVACAELASEVMRLRALLESIK